MASQDSTKSDGSESDGGGLLGPDDPAPVADFNPAGGASFLLLGDHAGLACPRALGDLGVGDADWRRHIACDIGSRALGKALARRLDARFLHQRYSRLIIDCNRDPAHPDAIPPASDGTPIPGNRSLDPARTQARVDMIHAPYHAAIADALDRRPAAIVVSLHSFTPIWQGAARPWHCGVLHGGGDDRFALAVLAGLEESLGPAAGDNEPYHFDATDYTVPRHAIARGLPYLELEVRQDLLADAAAVSRWTDRLAPILAAAARTIGAA